MENEDLDPLTMLLHIETQGAENDKDVEMETEDVQDALQSLVEAKAEGQEVTADGVIDAIQKTAKTAGAFYDQVLRWKRIPRAFASMKDNERELVMSSSLSRWLNSELSRPGVLPNDEPLDEELVGYVVGLLEHPDFCQPDLLVLELHEFLGSSVTKIVLALWKFMIVEIGLHSVFKAEKTKGSNQIQVNSAAKCPDPVSSATDSQSQPRDATIGRDFKRRRASYRGKVGTKTGPAAFREMIQKHMIGLSMEMDRELVLGGGFQDDVAGDKDSQAQSKRHTPVNWRNFTDALEVRNRSRPKCQEIRSSKSGQSKSRSRSRGRSTCSAYSNRRRSTDRKSRSSSSSRSSRRRERDRRHRYERKRSTSHDRDRYHRHRRGEYR